MYEPRTLCRNSEWCAISALKSLLAATSICAVVIVGELCTRLPQIGIMASKTLKLAGFPRPQGLAALEERGSPDCRVQPTGTECAQNRPRRRGCGPRLNPRPQPGFLKDFEHGE